MEKLLMIGLAGACGALSRYGLSLGVHHACGAGFPYGTFIVNILGCFLFGFVWMLFGERLMGSDLLRLMALTGFMGAFTTFSTFSFETVQLIKDAEWILAVVNVTGQIILGLVGMVMGMMLGKYLFV